MITVFELLPCTGPRALMLAVLEDAVRCIENGRRRRRFGARRLAAEAEAWVRCVRADWPFSFLNVCEALGIDVDALRSRLLEIPPRRKRPCRKEGDITISTRQACAHG